MLPRAVAVTTAATVYLYVSTNFPIPAPMVCKGNLVANWEFLCQHWEDYEVVTGLNKQSSKIRLASFRSVMGKDCLQTFPPKEEVNLVGKEKGKNFKKLSNDKFKQSKNHFPNKKKQNQTLETESAKTVAPNTSETNARHTINVALTVRNGTTLLVCVWLRRKVKSISSKKAMKAQIQRNQLSKWKTFRLLIPVVIDGSPHSASIVNTTST